MTHVFLDIDWNFFNHEFMGDKVVNYVWSGGIILLTLVLKKPLATLLTRISSGIATRYTYLKHKDAIRNMLLKPMERLLQVVLYYVAIIQVDGMLDNFAMHHIIGRKKAIDISLADVVNHVFMLLSIIFLAQVISSFIDLIYYLRMGKAETEKNYSRLQLIPLIKEMAKLLLWVLSTFWILGSVFHVNIAGLIAGLSIGGVAVALAAKETVENFFAAFTILSDKPFQTGDAIKLGEIEGVVERIGFRSTRLRNVDGSAYIIPNQNIVSQNLVNLSSRDTRGMKIVANIRYGINHEALQELIGKIKDTLQHTDPVKDPIDITIETFDKETFQMVVAYHLPHPLPEGMKLLELKKEINLKVFNIISGSAVMGTPLGTS